MTWVQDLTLKSPHILACFQRMEWGKICVTEPQRTWENLEQGSETGSQLQFQYQFKYPYLTWLNCILWNTNGNPFLYLSFNLQGKEIASCRETSGTDIFIRMFFPLFKWLKGEKVQISPTGRCGNRKNVNETACWQSHSLRSALCAWNTLPEDSRRESRESLQEGGREVGMAT